MRAPKLMSILLHLSESAAVFVGQGLRLRATDWGKFKDLLIVYS
jgi:hypothetical protein